MASAALVLEPVLECWAFAAERRVLVPVPLVLLATLSAARSAPECRVSKGRSASPPPRRRRPRAGK